MRFQAHVAARARRQIDNAENHGRACFRRRTKKYYTVKTRSHVTRHILCYKRVREVRA